MSFLKLMLRHFLRKKLFALINITGLGVGLAGVLLLALYIHDEWSIDRQHPQVQDKYRLETTLTAGNEILEIDASLPPIAPLLAANFPEVVDTTRFLTGRPYVTTEGGGTGFYENRLAFADPNIGTFFSFDWLRGDPATALSAPDSIVLTPAFARKYFGDADPLGRILVLDGKLSLRVTGVIADTSLDSHIDVEAFAPMAALQNLYGENSLKDWFGLGIATYVQLRPGTDMETLWPAIDTLLNDTQPSESRQLFAPRYRPLQDVHLATRDNPTAPRTRLDDAVILLSISLAILVVACINFVNLATARSTERQKEIGIRKVAGSGRWPIFLQHMGESVAMVLLALFLATGISELSLPVINAYTGKQLALFDEGFWIFGLLAGLAVAVLAGFYPALYLSRFRPLAVLRQRQREGSGIFALRNLLVIFQFTIAIIALVAGAVMMQQLNFAKTRDFGFDMRDVFVIENNPGEHWDSFRQAVTSKTGIEEVSAGLSRPFRSIATSARVRYDGGEAAGTNLSQFRVDFGYFELFDVPLLAGRYFSPQFGVDRQSLLTDENPHPELNIILNEAMAQRLGWTPESALGRRFEISAGPAPDFERSHVGTVIGVVADMYVDSIQREVVPQFYFVPVNVASLDFIFLKLRAGSEPEQITQVESIWRELYPDTPMNAYMLEEKFREEYQREERQLALLGAFAFLAVFISCIGLIGLATYATEQRIKEVGIRKTVGASVWQIVVLFSSDFSKLVLIANVIAWPVAYVAMSRWLENFAYRIDLTPVIFIGSGLIALCIAWVTVGGTAAKAANAKPVLALRYE
ncbi:MAG: ABC transporter permease [Pseudomonadota bacterium]|nr:ABC transporter permease [Pseudomonadota bacterium]